MATAFDGGATAATGPPPRPHRRSTTSSSRISTGSNLPRRSSTIMSGTTDEYTEEEEWEAGEEVGVGARTRRKKDEPMSPVVVVFYVTALYIIFQILTRSDEHEILSHLPPSLLSSTPIGLSGSNVHSDISHHPYSFPYHLPQLSSPLPASSDSSPGFWRGLLAVIIYPVYLIVTLLAIPLPLLFNAAHLVLSILSTVLYPFTSTFRLLTRTFVVGPFGVVRSVLETFYPIYTFVGGVVGVGCVMGMGAGWAGRAVLDLLYGKKKSASGSRRVKRRRDKDRPRSTQSTKIDREREPIPTIEPSFSQSHRSKTPMASSSSILIEQETPPALHRYAMPRTQIDTPQSHRGVPLSDISANVSTGKKKAIRLDKQRILDKLASNYRDIQHVENVSGAGRGPSHDRYEALEGARASAREDVAVGTRKRSHHIPSGSMR